MKSRNFKVSSRLRSYDVSVSVGSVLVPALLHIRDTRGKFAQGYFTSGTLGTDVLSYRTDVFYELYKK